MTAATEAQCEAALRKHSGIVSLAAKEIGVSRQALHQRIERSDRLQAALLDIDEATLDEAEGVIVDAIVVKRDVSTARWYAERKGKKRGFGTSGEIRLPLDQIKEIARSFVGNIDGARKLLAELKGQ